MIVIFIEVLTPLTDKYVGTLTSFVMHLWMDQLTHKFILTIGLMTSAILLSRCSILGSSGLRHAENISFSAPTDWRVTDSEGESDKAFKLPSGSTVTVTSSCHENRQVSLHNLTKDLLLGARKVKFIRQENVNIAKTQALLSHVNATVEGQAFQLLFVVLRKNGCVFDFSLVSTKSIPEKEIKDFLEFAKSLEYGQS